MDAFGNVHEDEVLILHCHENGDCHEPDVRHSDRSRVGPELLQLADDLFRSNFLVAPFKVQWPLRRADFLFDRTPC